MLGWVAVDVPVGHEGLEDGEKDIAVFGDAAFLPDDFRVDADQGVVRKGGQVLDDRQYFKRTIKIPMNIKFGWIYKYQIVMNFGFPFFIIYQKYLSYFWSNSNYI